MRSRKACLALVLALVVSASGCTASNITNPDKPSPAVLNQKTSDIPVEEISGGEVEMRLKNRGDRGKVGTAVIFTNESGIVNSTSKVIDMESGERRRVVFDVEVPDDAESFSMFASYATAKSR